MHFLFECFEHVRNDNRLAFLEFVWEMFWNGTFHENTDGVHAWVRSFDPLYNKTLFRNLRLGLAKGSFGLNLIAIILQNH